MDMNTKVMVQIKNVYGAEKIYPVNTPGQLLAKLVGQKTLTRDNIAIIREMGFTVEVVQDRVTL